MRSSVEKETECGITSGFILSGGSIDDDFAMSFLGKEQADGSLSQRLIAADRGADFCLRHDLKPEYVLGDFDSANSRTAEYYRRLPGIQFRTYPSEKDQTDTQLAVELGIELGWKTITVFGATGSRLDHVLGNVQVLQYALDRGTEVLLLDPHNRIRMVRERFQLPASEQFGNYISLIPWGGPVEHLTIRGMKYEVTDIVLKTGDALGISNECDHGTADIRFERGYLVVVESRD